VGRNSQQASRPGKQLDFQIPQPGRKTYPNQVSSASYPNVYDVNFPNPQGNFTKNKNHTKGILVAWSETRKKWELVAWEKVYKPKRKGGLGLHDPQVTNDAYGVKLWWRWVKEVTMPRVNQILVTRTKSTSEAPRRVQPYGT
jgi:hypothetical protein